MAAPAILQRLAPENASFSHGTCGLRARSEVMVSGESADSQAAHSQAGVPVLLITVWSTESLSLDDAGVARVNVSQPRRKVFTLLIRKRSCGVDGFEVYAEPFLQ